ncbi:MAG TPA: hypothetical protein PK636_07350, partial [bacterium]|nr:hypothetical protein [bacterium]
MFSMPWRHLATVIVPDLFGTLTCSQGVKLGFPGLEDYLHVEGNLTGGYFLVLVVVLGAVAGLTRREKGNDDRYVRLRRRWWGASICLVGFSWLLVTGSYSPVYLALVRLGPACGLPYAVRWRILEHLGMALAAGVSVHWLFASPRPLRRWAAVALGALIAGIFISQGMYSPPGGRPAALVAWEQYRGWLLTGPGALLLVVLLATVLVAVFNRRRWLKTFLLGALMAEAAVQGFLVVYFLEWADVPEWIKYRYPSETAYYRMTAPAPLPLPVSGPLRTVYYFSLLDQTATLHGGDYLFGHCSKPLVPRLREAVEEVATGYPYALRLRNPGMRFYPNMSVARIWLKPAAPGGNLVEYRPRDVLPRVFTQNRAVLTGPDEAREELIRGDLRQAAFVESSLPVPLETIGYGELKTLGNPQAGFDELQRRNRVEKVGFPSPARMNVAISVEVPALLVATDVFHPDWEVMVDGAPAAPLRVNYIQRAVYLEPGEHEVEWSFRPPAVRRGLWLVAVGLLGTAAV